MSMADPEGRVIAGDETTVYAVGEHGLVMYGPEAGADWIGSQDALHLRDWR